MSRRLTPSRRARRAACIAARKAARDAGATGSGGCFSLRENCGSNNTSGPPPMMKKTTPHKIQPQPRPSPVGGSKAK